MSIDVNCTAWQGFHTAAVFVEIGARKSASPVYGV